MSAKSFVHKSLLAMALVLVVALAATGCATTSTSMKRDDAALQSLLSTYCPDPRLEIPSWMFDCPEGT